MIIPLFTRLGVRTNVPDVEPTAYTPEQAELPDDHPCENCMAIDLRSGVPYCCLPHCNRDIFQITEHESGGVNT